MYGADTTVPSITIAKYEPRLAPVYVAKRSAPFGLQCEGNDPLTNVIRCNVRAGDLIARKEWRKRWIVKQCTLSWNWLGSLNWLARRDIYRSVCFRRERDEVKATGCAEQGTDGVRITDTREFHDDAVAPCVCTSGSATPVEFTRRSMMSRMVATSAGVATTSPTGCT